MLGPCAVENEADLVAAAAAAHGAGARLLRGGAFKPRTSPYAFQGLGDDGLPLLRRVADAFGLAVVSEATSEASVARVAEHCELIQIGARTMAASSLLKAAARAGRPVLLKRGFGATVDEWLAAAEYLLDGGAPGVILCERGIRSFEPGTRATLDSSAAWCWRKLRTGLPVHRRSVARRRHARARRAAGPRRARRRRRRAHRRVPRRARPRPQRRAAGAHARRRGRARARHRAPRACARPPRAKAAIMLERDMPTDDDDIRAAELRVAEVIGGLMEFWGFKAVMGRLWTILYLSPEPLVRGRARRAPASVDGRRVDGARRSAEVGRREERRGSRASGATSTSPRPASGRW